MLGADMTSERRSREWLAEEANVASIESSGRDCEATSSALATAGPLRVDPFAGPGVWAVVTASGAVHIIGSADAHSAVTVTRLVEGLDDADPEQEFALAHLRRDGHPVRVLALEHLTDDGHRATGVQVGADLLMALEPLGPNAQVTFRRTTPVRSIHALPFDAGSSMSVTPEGPPC